ncbi:MAG: HD domain-containing protein [Deltaproteobacteria bacterium]|nr:HD domain-containing protein [Deltaproteobacteria bacterium]MBW1861921.1 HD domain-containing protein [Deltaproteobacteria bacterium]
MDIPRFVMNILKRLHASGYQAYIVGGAVRDTCLRRTVTDWDVATSAPPAKIRSLFRDIRNFSLGHDTVTLVNGAHHYEVTTYRGSKNFGHTIEEDLGHRDFTINGMAYDTDKNKILDPNEGRKDILRRLVRAVGDPKKRFREDPIRLLRAVRLATELGFRIEQKTLETMSMMSDQLVCVAHERTREELMKILMSQRPSHGFNLMVRTGLLRQLLPELLEGYLKRQNAYHRYTIYKHTMETVDRVKPDPILRLIALLHDIAKPRTREKIKGEYRFLGHEEASAGLAKEIMTRLKFSNEMIGKVTNLIAHHMIGYDSAWSDGAVRRLIRRVGPENMDHLLSLRRADLLAHGLKDQKIKLLPELEKRIEGLSERELVVKTRDLAIGGHEVMGILGLRPGPEVGSVLKALMEKVTDRPELNTHKRLVALLKETKD